MNKMKLIPWMIFIISVVSILFIDMEIKLYFIFTLIALVSIYDILSNDKETRRKE